MTPFATSQLHGHRLLVGAAFGHSHRLASLADHRFTGDHLGNDEAGAEPFTSLRNGKSLTPDMGARMTGSSRLTEAIEMPIEYATMPLPTD